MSKKYLYVIICIVLMALMIGCQNGEGNTAPTVDPSSAQSVAQEEIAEETTAESDSVIDEMKEESPTNAESSQEESSEAESPQETEAEPEETVPLVIGTNTGSETQVVIQVTNELTSAVTSIQFGEPFGDFKTENLLPEGTVLASGEMKVMYFDPQTVSGAVDYNVYLVMEDGTEATLHSFPYNNVDAVTIKDSGQVIYIEYISLSSGELRDSEMSEYLIKFSGSGSGQDNQGADPNAGCVDDGAMN